MSTAWPDAFEKLVREQCRFLTPDQAIDPDAPLGTLGVDSFGSLVLIGAIEDELGVVLPDEALTAETFRTMRSLWAVVAEVRDGAGHD